MTAPSNNSIFVVGFPETVTKDDLQSFLTKNLPNATVSNVAVLKGRSRFVDGERQPGTPYSFVTFAEDASVKAALGLMNKKLEGDFANIKIEQVGNKERVNNSLYVTGLTYSDKLQEELKKFFESNLKTTVEVDVRKAIVKNKETNEEEDKSFAFVFFNDEQSKKAALDLKGGKVCGSTVDIQERAERKPRPARRPHAAAAAGSNDDDATIPRTAGGRGGNGRGRAQRGRGRGGRGRARGARGRHG